MARLYDIGYPFDQAMIEFRHQLNNMDKSWFWCIIENFQAGKTFCESMEPLKLSPAVSTYLRVAETSGDISICLREIAIFYHSKLDLRDKIVNSLLYPLLLFLANITVVIYLQETIVPQLQNLYETLHIPVSSTSAYLFRALQITVFIIPYTVSFILILVITLIVAYKFWPQSKYILLQLYSGLPVPLVRLHINWSWLHQLSILLRGGIDIVSSLETMSSCADFPLISIWSKITLQRLTEGLLLSESILGVTWVDRRIGIFMKLADKEGDYAVAFQEAANEIRQDLENRLNRLPKLLEPIMLGMSGLFIGAIYLAMMLPVYDLLVEFKF